MTQTETRIFHYDLLDHLIAETDETGTTIAEYFYLWQQPVAMIRPGEALYYYHNDHLGTPQILTNDSGAVSWKALYTPFGEAVISVETVENPFRFPGQYYDQETGLHYNWNRYYDPKTGRYLTPDPIGLEGGINLWPYVANNPMNNIDPSGLSTIVGDPRFGCPPGINCLDPGYVDPNYGPPPPARECNTSYDECVENAWKFLKLCNGLFFATRLACIATCTIACVGSGPAYLACVGSCAWACFRGFSVGNAGCYATYIALVAACKHQYRR